MTGVPTWTPAPIGGPEVRHLALGWVAGPTALVMAALLAVVWMLARRRESPAPAWAMAAPAPPGQSPPPPPCARCRSEVGAADRYCWRCGWPVGTPPGPWATGAEPITAFGATLADWATRAASMVIDAALLAGPWVIMAVSLGVAQGARRRAGQDVVLQPGGTALAVAYLGAIASGLVYFGVLNGWRRGQTVGNLATNIAVCDARTGRPVGLARGGLRWTVRFLLYAMLLVPGILNDLFPLWDRNRQTIADKAARTVVVRVRG